MASHQPATEKPNFDSCAGKLQKSLHQNISKKHLFYLIL